MFLELRTRIIALVAFLAIIAPTTLFAQSCPAETVYIGEDDDYLYCKRLGDYIGNDQATRAAILKRAMERLRYPYHEIKGRCLSGEVSMCPIQEHPNGCYDCSALVFEVLRSVGVWVQPTADNQYRYFESIPQGIKKSDPSYGDVIFILSEDGSHISHTGIYVGTRDNRIYFLNASTSRMKVWVSRMSQGKSPYAYGNVSVLRIGKSD